MQEDFSASITLLWDETLEVSIPNISLSINPKDKVESQDSVEEKEEYLPELTLGKGNLFLTSK
jgi:hypothetical protein